MGYALFIFTVLTRAHEYIPNYEIYRPSVLFGMMMLLGLYFHILLGRLRVRFHNPQSIILSAFIAFCWISLLVQSYVESSEASIREIEPLLLVLVCYFVLINVVRNFRDFRIILNTLALSGITIAILSVVQSFATGITFGKGAYWVYHGSSGLIQRAGTLGLNPNGIAIILSALLPLFVFLSENERKSFVRKKLYILAIPLLALTTLLTLSRAGFIGLIIAFLLISRRRLKPTYLISIGILMVVVFLYVPEMAERILSTSSADTTGGGRLLIWEGAFNMIKDHPFTGVGYGQFMKVFNKFQPHFPPVVCHNSYLSIAAETGIITLFTFLGLVVLTLFDVGKLRRVAALLDDPWVAQISGVLGVSIILILISGLTHNTHHDVLLYINIALVVVLKRLTFDNINSKLGSIAREETKEGRPQARSIFFDDRFV
ncbi:O-antigen ligase family protein [bacterium]|nr:O-antigen ligase family protein [bacterium]